MGFPGTINDYIIINQGRGYTIPRLCPRIENSETAKLPPKQWAMAVLACIKTLLSVVTIYICERLH